MAPGRNIAAAKANPTNGYVTDSGTSMAAPFLAGVVGLMLDANYALDDAGIKGTIYPFLVVVCWNRLAAAIGKQSVGPTTRLLICSGNAVRLT